MKHIILALCIFLASCAADLGKQPTNGITVDTPIWAIMFCQEHPSKPECQP